MWVSIVALALGASVQAEGTCDCVCMEGQPTTLCRTVEQAQAGPNLCTLAQHCPDILTTDTQDAQDYLKPPSSQAHRCRSVRVWDQGEQRHHVINICDVLPLQ